MELLTLAGADAHAFAGLGDGDGAMGLTLSGVDFGLAVMTNRADPAQQFTALTASAESAGFVGTKAVTVSADDLFVAVNRGTASGVVVDFSAAPLSIPVGGGEYIIDLDGDRGELTEASGHVTLNVAGS